MRMICFNLSCFFHSKRSDTCRIKDITLDPKTNKARTRYPQTEFTKSDWENSCGKCMYFQQNGGFYDEEVSKRNKIMMDKWRKDNLDDEWRLK